MMKTLIVDDDPQNLYLLKVLLEAHGHEVVLAGDGAQALEKAREAPPDLVVSDILMPGMDGFALCREWRKDEELKHIPFLFYTATYTDDKDEELALAEGADGFIRKPADPDEFIRAVEAGLADARRGDAVPVAPGPSKEDVLKLYSKRLVKKLEKKMLDVKAEAYGREVAEEKLLRVNRALRMLTECNRTLVRAETEATLLQDMCRTVVQVGGYRSAWVGFTEGETGLRPAACIGSDGSALGVSGLNTAEVCQDSCPAVMAVRTGRPEVVRDLAGASESGCPFLQAVVPEGGAAVALPLTDGGSAFGALSVFSTRLDAFDGDEMTLLMELADDLAYGIMALRTSVERRRADEALRESEERYRLLAENASDVIWTMDMDLHYTYFSPSVTRQRGYSVEEALSRTMEELLAPASYQVATKVFAEALALEKTAREDPGGSRTLELELMCKDGSTIWGEVNITFIHDERGQAVGVLGVTREIGERKRAEEDLLRSSRRLRSALNGTVSAVASIVEMRDPYTAGHQRRVAQLAGAIAEEMGLPQDQRDGMRMAAAVHDVGKIRVPAEILSKPGRLTAIELRLVQNHAEAGYEVLKDIEFPWPVAEIVWQHHERMNGSGYPRGLKGEDIRICARILAVSDVVEAMSSHRPYRPALGTEEALGEIAEGSGKLYDSDVVAACVRLFRERGFEFEEA